MQLISQLLILTFLLASTSMMQKFLKSSQVWFTPTYVNSKRVVRSFIGKFCVLCNT